MKKLIVLCMLALSACGISSMNKQYDKPDPSQCDSVRCEVGYHCIPHPNGPKCVPDNGKQ